MWQLCCIYSLVRVLKNQGKTVHAFSSLPPTIFFYVSLFRFYFLSFPITFSLTSSYWFSENWIDPIHNLNHGPTFKILDKHSSSIPLTRAVHGRSSSDLLANHHPNQQPWIGDFANWFQPNYHSNLATLGVEKLFRTSVGTTTNHHQDQWYFGKGG